MLDSPFMCTAVVFCTRKRSFITILNVPHRLSCRHLSHFHDRRGKAKNSEAAEPGTLLHVESASCWRGRSLRRVRRSHQGFIYRVLFTNFNPTFPRLCRRSSCCCHCLGKKLVSEAEGCGCAVALCFPYRLQRYLTCLTSTTSTGRRPLQSRAWWRNEKEKENTDKQKRNPKYYPL